ncbi:MAG: hypothetical protein Q4G26_03800 [Paracoccus sp. (in: a-proteobacteria)]|nr:hypothetical protein [Paracoccus sp. (in: a-proteobacteria)]
MRAPQLGPVLDLESEPLTKLLEVSAYREMVIHARINDAARAVMLLSMLGSPGRSACAESVAKMRVQRPRWLQWLKRLQIVVEGPYSGGQSCQRQPTRST